MASWWDGALGVVRSIDEFFVRAPWLGYLLLVVLTWVLARQINGLVLRPVLLSRRVEVAIVRLLGRLFVVAVVVTAMFVYASALFSANVAALITTLGLVSLAVGFGLQNTVANIAGGISLAVDRPFRIGDMIEIGDILGDVQDIGIRSTRVLTLNKEFVVIPNKYLEEQPITNLTMIYPELRVDIPIGISYDSDHELAERILLDVASAHPVVLRSPPPRMLMKGYGSSSMDLELQVFVSDPRKRLIVTSDLLKATKDRFDLEGVEIPYPYEVQLEKSTMPAPKRLERDRARPSHRVSKPWKLLALVDAASSGRAEANNLVQLAAKVDAEILGVYALRSGTPDAADQGNRILSAIDGVAQDHDVWFKPILRSGTKTADVVAEVAKEERPHAVVVRAGRTRLPIDWRQRGAGLAVTQEDLRERGVDVPIFAWDPASTSRKDDVDAELKALLAKTQSRTDSDVAGNLADTEAS